MRNINRNSINIDLHHEFTPLNRLHSISFWFSFHLNINLSDIILRVPIIKHADYLMTLLVPLQHVDLLSNRAHT